MSPGWGPAFPVFPGACSDGPVPDWAATHPLEILPLDTPDPQHSKKKKQKKKQRGRGKKMTNLDKTEAMKHPAIISGK